MAIKFVSKSKSGAVQKVNPPSKLAKATTPTEEEFPLDKAHSATAIPLQMAHSMYQPVQGTSPSSRYFMTGRAGHIKLATRFTGGKVSVRFESPKGVSTLKSVKSESLGLTQSANHISTHILAGDFEAALRIVGAVMLQVGVTWDTPLPSKTALKKVWGV